MKYRDQLSNPKMQASIQEMRVLLRKALDKVKLNVKYACYLIL